MRTEKSMCDSDTEQIAFIARRQAAELKHPRLSRRVETEITHRTLGRRPAAHHAGIEDGFGARVRDQYGLHTSRESRTETRHSHAACQELDAFFFEDGDQARCFFRSQALISR